MKEASKQEIRTKFQTIRHFCFYFDSSNVFNI